MAASVLIANITQDWMDSLQRWHLEFFFIPTTVVTVATLLVNPVLLACICRSRALRQETRYLLVANTLMADVLFLLLNLTTMVCNQLGVQMPWLLCELVTAATVTAYCSAILTVTLMVVDTYAAVRWPLRYHAFLPPARARHILAGVWVLAALYPFTLVIMMESERLNPHDEVPVCLFLVSLGFIQVQNILGVHIYFVIAALLCASLILFCYFRLYMVTRTHGIWQTRFSRARVTLLAHGLLLFLYFTPGFIFTLELTLFQKDDVSHDVQVWISTVNMCGFMLLPRAFAPYLYGLRYREVSDSLLKLLHRNTTPDRVTLNT